MELHVDGKTVFVATGGREIDPALPSIVFVHGTGLDHTVWTLPTRYFVRHGRSVLAVDLPGHGRSVGRPLTRIGEMADWIAQVITAAGLEQAAIVGHSMGSLVALETAAQHPEQARTIALLGTSAPMTVNDQLLATAKNNDHAAIDMLNLWGHSYIAQVGGYGAPGMWKTGGNLRLLEQAARGVLYADLKACNDYVDGIERAGRVRCPALLIIADRDVMTPASVAKTLGDAIPEVRTVLIESCGHAMLAEQPNAVLDALIEVL